LSDWAAAGELAGVALLEGADQDPEGAWMYALELAQAVLWKWELLLRRIGDSQATAEQLADRCEA